MINTVDARNPPNADIIAPRDEKVPLFEIWRPTESWVRTTVFSLRERGIAANVERVGDAQRGTIGLVLAAPDGTCRLLSQLCTSEGGTVWMRSHRRQRLDRLECGVRILEMVSADPDLWVLEVDEEAFVAEMAVSGDGVAIGCLGGCFAMVDR